MRPPNPIHPGRMLKEEFLAPTGVSQRAFARKIGWTTAKLNNLISGKRGITANSALDLADELGVEEQESPGEVLKSRQEEPVRR